MTPDAFRAQLREAVLASGLRQTEVAARMGITPQLLSAYLSGAKTPSLARLLALCEAAGLSLRAVPSAD